MATAAAVSRMMVFMVCLYAVRFARGLAVAWVLFRVMGCPQALQKRASSSLGVWQLAQGAPRGCPQWPQ